MFFGLRRHFKNDVRASSVTVMLEECSRFLFTKNKGGQKYERKRNNLCGKTHMYHVSKIIA